MNITNYDKKLLFNFDIIYKNTGYFTSTEDSKFQCQTYLYIIKNIAMIIFGDKRCLRFT